ncbi:Uncharacterised protein [Mycobacterium tuberculosis]|nr:Uncharacterised protein [Mycobacterium tuberculosis]
MVHRFQRKRLTHSMSRARVTRRRGSATALTGAVGNTPLTKHSSLQYTLPIPASTRWSSSASAMGRSGATIRLAAARCGSQSSASRSGPRCATTAPSLCRSMTSNRPRSTPTTRMACSCWLASKMIRAR